LGRGRIQQRSVLKGPKELVAELLSRAGAEGCRIAVWGGSGGGVDRLRGNRSEEIIWVLTLADVLKNS
jgi:hypothetical protein